ncbi:MAG: tRNA (5-methylaminomethyl-2-thiouridine)(34)-methyltransferase MnmD [Flavobacteriales bacterium]|jgi:tRNA U34 5-methylaminomethyl-2-thiouridine-forming methyltransferase MnmC|nr:tRNA (5-methylaminomethyl-2-thiouridine)(34)-methyltransferase MnmD [Flavobacteriales bacterium]MBT6014024.1 tRNA (5-methylaminomethyl-2-thiouridine)(34)-methyltransferase MnmD [Flavobacteriales bacterium]MBT7481901.1 tRNA (5-methylaminomethyl-2-thiouridine)(34)-methyltransferase MnmD [Flavobacteriales bacterium]
MKKELIITKDGSHSLFVPELNENYHSVHGAIEEALHVFIKNGIHSHPKQNINILEIGFGTGLNTLLTLENKKEVTVNYTALEPYPVSEKIYSKLNFFTMRNLDGETFLKLHTSDWEKEIEISGGFTFFKSEKRLQNFTTKKKFDIIYFDAFSPETQAEMWTEEVFKKCFNLLNKDGFLVTYCAKGVVKRTLKSIGYEVETLDGPTGKREMTRANKKGS